MFGCKSKKQANAIHNACHSTKGADVVIKTKHEIVATTAKIDHDLQVVGESQVCWNPQEAPIYGNQSKEEDALLLVNLKNYDGAIDIYLEILSKYPQNSISNFDYARICTNLGDLYFIKGDFQNALKYYRRELGINEESHESYDEPTIADSLMRIAKTVSATQQYSYALKLFQKAFDIRKKVYGIEHAKTIETQLDIAWTYKYAGMYELSLAQFYGSLGVQQKVYGMCHEELITTYASLGKVLLEHGDFDQALTCCGKALDISREIHGNESSHTASAYFNLGRIYFERGDCDKAIQSLEKSLVIRKSVFGDTHPKVAISFFHLGIALDKKGDVYDSLQCMKKAISIDEQTSMENEAAEKCSKIASMWAYQKGDYDTALDFLLKSLNLTMKKKKEATYQDTELDLQLAHRCETIAMVYLLKNNYDMAVNFYRRAYTIRCPIQGSSHKDVLRCCKSIGDVLLRIKNYDLALFYFGTALDIELKLKAVDRKIILHDYKRMERAFRLKGDEENANRYLQMTNALEKQLS